MPNAQVDNGVLGSLNFATKILSGTVHVEGLELVTATEGGTRVDLAKATASAFSSGHFGLVGLAVRRDTPTSLVPADGNYTPLITDSQGRLHIAPIPAGSDVIGAVSVTGVTPGVGNTDLGKAEDAVHASGDVGVMGLLVRKDTPVALAAEGAYHPGLVDEAGRIHVNVGALPAADVTTDSIGVAQGARSTPPADMVALLPIKRISTATTNAIVVKTSPGQLYWLHVINLNTAVRYIKLYNKASAPVVGTDVPIHTFPIPGDAAGLGWVLSFPVPITFATGIGMALTTGVADNDATAVAANEIIVNGGYA